MPSLPDNDDCNWAEGFVIRSNPQDRTPASGAIPIRIPRHGVGCGAEAASELASAHVTVEGIVLQEKT